MSKIKFFVLIFFVCLFMGCSSTKENIKNEKEQKNKKEEKSEKKEDSIYSKPKRIIETKLINLQFSFEGPRLIKIFSIAKYKIHFSNNGDTEIKNFQIVNYIPKILKYIYSDPKSSISDQYENYEVVKWNFKSLKPGEKKKVEITVETIKAGKCRNKVRVIREDRKPGTEPETFVETLVQD